MEPVFLSTFVGETFKRLIASKSKEVPYTHDLKKLSLVAGLNLEETQIKQLNEITTFNLGARYDDYKRSFYKKATKEYTEKWMKISKELYTCIKKEIK